MAERWGNRFSPHNRRAQVRAASAYCANGWPQRVACPMGPVVPGANEGADSTALNCFELLSTVLHCFTLLYIALNYVKLL